MITIKVILLTFINLATNSVEYAQHSTPRECREHMTEIQAEAAKHNFNSYVTYCNEYEIELESV